MVITVTLNPAMDKVLILDQFKLNVTNRIKEQFSCVGGKGTHISINLSLLGIRSMAVGAVMGEVGSEILKELGKMNIDVQFLHLSEGNSRTNYVLIDEDANCTLVAEKGKPMEQEVTDRLVQVYKEKVSKGDIVVISGDASNQRNTNLQDTFMEIAGQKGARVCLDASGEHLARGVRKSPFLIKPNIDELSALTGKELNSEGEILRAIEELDVFGIENIVVSCGGEGSIVRSNGRYFKVIAPKVEVRNTVGCGDALVSGLLAGFEKNLAIEENLKQASAIAAATAMNIETVGFDISLIDMLKERVVVKALEK